MTENTMPVTEATVDVDEKEVVNYELAFHVLPTVAEGEVADVFAAVKKLITTHGGVITNEEAPKHFELAYPIVKHTEGKNRTYSTAYFGWIRLTALPADVQHILAETEERADILRTLLVKLTKQEIEHPFFFHESLNQKKVVDVDVTETDNDKDTPEDTEDEEIDKVDVDVEEDTEEDEDSK